MAPFRSAPFGSNVHGPVPPPLVHSSEGPVHAGMQQTASDTGDDGIDHGVTAVPYEHRFSPYDFNGGTVAAVAGEDYCVVAADTRLSSGYEILSRNVTKMHAVTGKCVLASSGCKTDVDQLRSVLDIKMKVCYLMLP
jgi:20S proteasome alpha/beta subunit